MASHGVLRPPASIEKSEQQRALEQQEIQDYQKLEHSIKTKLKDQQHTAEVFGLTTKLLTANPEYYTIWNIRRRLLICGLFPKSRDVSSSSMISQNTNPTVPSSSSSTPASSSTSTACVDSPTISQNRSSQISVKNGTTLELIQSDLVFLVPLMLRYPKCYWLWKYRLWLLEEANRRLTPGTAREIWSQELILVGKMLTKDSRNHHGWSHRRIVVVQLESAKLNGQSMVESEFEYTTKMIHAPKGLSNFSAWHRRSKLLPRLLEERDADAAARRQFMDEEFDLIVSAMYTDSYPYQQSAWFYYQFLMTTLTNPAGHAVLTPHFTATDRINYVLGQLDILKDMLDGAEDCKWIYDALIEYTLSLSSMERRELKVAEKKDCRSWLLELRKLDSFRNGRWDDLESLLQT